MFFSLHCHSNAVKGSALHKFTDCNDLNKNRGDSAEKIWLIIYDYVSVITDIFATATLVYNNRIQGAGARALQLFRDFRHCLRETNGE